MKTVLIMLIRMLVLMLSIASISEAITHGEKDVEGHPNVVLIVVDVNGFPAWRCSGTMLSDNYVLTAGHCVDPLVSGVSGMRIFTESDVENGNNSYPFAGSNSIEAVRWAAHPNYVNEPFSMNDVGMIELAESFDPGVFGELPEPDSLDEYKTRRGLNKLHFTAVGYGLQRIVSTVHLEAERIRYVAEPRLIQINTGFVGDYSLLLSNNHSTGGTCFGDSGGANFLNDTNIVAGVTSFGLNGNCAGTGGVFRMDRQDVLDFINDFME